MELPGASTTAAGTPAVQDFDKGSHRRLQRFRCGAWSTVARYLTGGSNPRSMIIHRDSATATEGRANSRIDVSGGLALGHGTPYTETSAKMSVVGLI